MRIGELASRTGVSIRSLRYYEEVELLHSRRSPSNQRHYEDAAAERVEFIQRLFNAGLSSATIRDLLPCVDSPSDRNSDAALERMRQEHDRLTRHIVDLQRTRDSLEDLIAANRHYRESGECLSTPAHLADHDEPVATT